MAAQPCSDGVAGVPAGGGQGQGEHGRGGGLAVRSGHCHELVLSGYSRQCHRPVHHLDAECVGGLQFGVVRCDGGGDDYELCTTHVVRIVPHVHACTELGEALQHG